MPREPRPKDYIILIYQDQKIKLRIYNGNTLAREMILTRRQLANLLVDAAGIASIVIK